MTDPPWRTWLDRFQSLLALGLMVVALALLSDRFLTTDNGLTILRAISVNLCLSIAMTLVIVSGGIDLSVGAILALAGAVAAGLLKSGLAVPAFGVRLQFTMVGTIVAGVAVGAALGWCNGFVIARFRLPPFVATLGMLSIARGLTMLWTGGFPITDLGPAFGFLGSGTLFGVPMPVWIVALLVGMFATIARQTVFGRHVYALGSNELTARLAGLSINRIRIAAEFCCHPPMHRTLHQGAGLRQRGGLA